MSYWTAAKNKNLSVLAVIFCLGLNHGHYGQNPKARSFGKKQINVLNLFAYTGGSTLAASSAGAAVTHLDASKEMVTWAHENAKLSGLSDRPVRWIVDDATTFVKRELKRNHSYDGIIIDPPKFGRSENGKLWKIEDDLLPLLQLCCRLLSKQPLFIILNNGCLLR